MREYCAATVTSTRKSSQLVAQAPSGPLHGCARIAARCARTVRPRARVVRAPGARVAARAWARLVGLLVVAPPVPRRRATVLGARGVPHAVDADRGGAPDGDRRRAAPRARHGPDLRRHDRRLGLGGVSPWTSRRSRDGCGDAHQRPVCRAVPRGVERLRVRGADGPVRRLGDPGVLDADPAATRARRSRRGIAHALPSDRAGRGRSPVC